MNYKMVANDPVGPKTLIKIELPANQFLKELPAQQAAVTAHIYEQGL